MKTKADLSINFCGIKFEKSVLPFILAREQPRRNVRPCL